jgi:two-component system chemotaxis response regulator CheY
MDVGALIVDDVKEIRVVLKDIVRGMGIQEIYEATNGVEALEILSGRDEKDRPISQRVRFLICDVNMPKMNGMQLLRAVRKSDHLKHVSVIIITGESTEKRILESIKLGADAFVAKPYTVQTIEDKIREVLEKRDRRERREKRA